MAQKEKGTSKNAKRPDRFTVPASGIKLAKPLTAEQKKKIDELNKQIAKQEKR